MEIGNEFVTWLRSEVGVVADKYEVAPHRAFPAWAFRFAFDMDEAEAFNETDTLSQGDAGLDGWFLDTDNSVLHLAQAKYLDKPLTASVDPDGLRALLHAVLLLQNPGAIEQGVHADKLTRIAIALERALEDDFSVSLDFFVAGVVSDQTKLELNTAISQLGPGYSAAFYDTSRLHEMWLSQEPIGDLSGITVDVELSGADEFYVKGGIVTPGVEESAITSLDGKSIAEAVSTFGARLFHANVRYYLAKSNRVNKGMLKTLDSPDERKSFWLYNNGLTIVADSFEFVQEAQGTVLRATNPQIVNGAQTSSVLRDRLASLTAGDVAVQARVIAVKSNEDGRQALLKISEYTNSQSPVKLGDLRSNDLRHRKLQKAFSTLTPAVFYERRRGEWQSLDSATRATYGRRRVAKDNVGQRFLAYSGHPAVAIGDKDSIYAENEALAFNTTVPASVYMLAHNLFEAADELLVPKGQDALRALVPSFVTTDSKATPTLLAIRRSRKLMAAHAVALAKQVLDWRYTAVGESRAAALRTYLEEDAAASAFLWRQVFRAVWTWSTTLSDLSELRGALQKQSTLAVMSSYLQNNLVDLDRKSVLKVLS